MVGLRQRATRSAPIPMKSLENISMKDFGCISLMSAPAANAFSPPASRMHPMLSSASRSSTAAAISLNTPKDSALSIFGRFSVMTPTAPLLSTMMCSNVLMVHPVADFRGQCARWRDGLQVGASCPWRGAAPWRCALRPGQETTLRHEHARGGGHGEQRAEADEDFPDQGGLIPGGAFIVAGSHHGRHRGGRRVGRGHRLRWRGGRGLVQRAVDIVELIGSDNLGLGSGLGIRRIIRRVLHNFIGPPPQPPWGRGGGGWGGGG